MYGKDFFASKTTWGSIMLLVGPALKAAGFEFDEKEIVEQAALLVGTVLFLVGQFTRKAEITSVAGVKVKSDA